MRIQRPKGTLDLLQGSGGWQDTTAWQWFEAAAREVARQYALREVRTPIYESRDLYAKGSGPTSDVVTKEMFDFQDKGGRWIAMRPELTPGLVRACLDAGLTASALPARVWSIGPLFRYENVQASRYRQHTQFDVEVLGAAGAETDAELIRLGLDLAGRLGLSGLAVQINSIGCPTCRPAYRARLQAHFRPVLGERCEDCNRRIDQNPLRLLDCKRCSVHPAQAGAPRTVDCLCPACEEHFQRLQACLSALSVPFVVNTRVVRGLDYYTRTVFEVFDPKIGAQGTLWGGGRYDGLVETLGGNPTPAVGFGMGVERMLRAVQEAGLPLPAARGPEVYVARLPDVPPVQALTVASDLRAAGLAVEMDGLERRLGAQIQAASKRGAQFVVILGGEEGAQGLAQLKELATGSQEPVRLAELAAHLRERLAASTVRES